MTSAHKILTPFQQLVHEALRKIPRGRVTTYRFLAKHVKCRSCRAVGQALRRNPFAPKVPCHRVIASNLTIGGFSAFGVTASKKGPEHKTDKAIKRKLALLRKEGVVFRQDKLANPALLYNFSEE